MKYLYTFLLCFIIFVPVYAQEGTISRASGGGIQPFLFSVNTLTDKMSSWNLAYSGGYGRRIDSPFGYDGVDQQFALRGYLGDHFTLFANMGLGFGNDGNVNSFQQVEVLRDILGGRQVNSSRFSLGLGARREWSNDKVLFSRLSGFLNNGNWRAIANLRIEKAFKKGGDNLDFLSSLGYQHRITNTLLGGFEAVGEDLEGFWQSNEAEGGAKMMIGPSINFEPSNAPFSISVCGGPAFYATKNKPIPDNNPIRDLGTTAVQNGYTLRFSVNYAF